MQGGKKSATLASLTSPAFYGPCIHLPQCLLGWSNGRSLNLIYEGGRGRGRGGSGGLAAIYLFLSLSLLLLLLDASVHLINVCATRDLLWDSSAAKDGEREREAIGRSVGRSVGREGGNAGGKTNWESASCQKKKKFFGR